MSHYSGVKDFRDVLKEKYNNSFEEFTEKTRGIVYQMTAGGQLKMIFIGSAAELVPYYSHTVSTDDNKIILSEYSHIDNIIDYLEELNIKYRSKNFVPFNTDILREKRSYLVDLYHECVKENRKEIV